MSRPQPILGDFYRLAETDSTADRAHQRIMQAEALASLLYGEQGEAFRNLADPLQDTVCWLLYDLISEYRVLHEKAAQEAQP